MVEEERAKFLVRGCGYVETQLSLYPIYKDDDMFRPLWAIRRSEKYIYREKIYSIRTLVVHILGFQRDLVVLRLSILTYSMVQSPS